MGLIGRIDHPKVKQTISDAVARISDAGRTAGAIAWASTAEEVVEAGARFLMTSWLPYLSAGANTYLEAVQRATGKVGDPIVELGISCASTNRSASTQST